MTSPAILPALLSALFLSANGTAQYLNRAVYLGRDGEGIRRDFSQDSEYLLTRFSYLHAPWWSDDLDPFRDTIEYSVGSISARDLTVEGRVQKRVELGSGFAAHFHLLQSETQDAQFLRSALEFEYEAGESWSAFAMFEGTGRKEDADVSIGAYIRDPREDRSYDLRLMLTAVDAAAAKSTETRYSKKPVGAMVSGVVGRSEDAQLGFEIAAQLPTELEEQDEAQSFAIERYIAKLEGRVPLGERTWFVSGIEAEYAERELTPLNLASVDLEHSRRDYVSARAEWWRRFASGNEFSTGVIFFHKNEDGYRPNQPSETLRIDAEEWFGIARGRMKFDESWSVEPSLFAGYAEYDEFVGTRQVNRARGFQGKAGLGLLYRFSERAQILLTMTAELDEAEFGGGNLQFKSTF